MSQRGRQLSLEKLNEFILLRSDLDQDDVNLMEPARRMARCRSSASMAPMPGPARARRRPLSYARQTMRIPLQINHPAQLYDHFVRYAHRRSSSGIP
jgi:hypothetical protein